MTRKCGVYASLIGLTFVLALLPGAALAQSSIAGLVTDETGGVLPGVTIEAASPALIERVRTAFTDGQGRYAIVDVRPGIYTVTFTLPGFSTLAREEIEVIANTSVPIDAQLSVGEVAETITVSGATPVIDVQQTARSQVLNRELLDALPTNRTVNSVGAIVPGIKMSGTMVGGLGSTRVQNYVRAPGQHPRQNTVMVEGVDVSLGGWGDGQQAYNNFGTTQEIALQTNPASAEVTGGGVSLNLIPRDGGNDFSGDVFFSGLVDAMQANNITPELMDRGLRTPDGTEWIYDLNPSVGGPIMQDRLWYFVSGRLNRAKLSPAGASFFEVDPATGFLGPGSQQAFNDTATDNISFRITWQVNETNKITTFRDQFWRYQSHFALNIGEDAATGAPQYNRGNQYIWPSKWTSTPSNRVLTEVGVQYYGFTHRIFQNQPGVTQPRPELGLHPAEQITPWHANAARRDLTLGTLHTAANNTMDRWQNMPTTLVSGAVSYVTGSHQLKVGASWTSVIHDLSELENNGALIQQYRRGVPDSVSVASVPSLAGADVNAEVGAYVQDRWTIDRLTVNAGLRLEHYSTGIRATSSAAGRFVPAHSVEAAHMFSFTNALPRFSLAYDLFGNARTAVKFSAGKFLRRMALNQVLRNFVPIGVRSETRNWFDCDIDAGGTGCSGLNPYGTNGDDIAQDNEIAPSRILNFGSVAPQQADDNFEREVNWQYQVSVDQQLMDGVSMTVGWYHQRESRLWALYDAAELLPNAFTRFDIASPLGNGEMVPVHNLSAEAGAQTGNIFVTASDQNHYRYHGFEVSGQARLPNGGTLTGGFFTERKVGNLCDVTDPNDRRFCDHFGEQFQELGSVPGMPFRHEIKLALAYPLPGDFQFGMSFISYPGGTQSYNGANANWLAVNYPVPSAAFAPVGGRTRSVTVNLIPPGTEFLDRYNQWDLSLKRTFRAGGMEVVPSLEIYNLSNASTVLRQAQTFGGALGRPSSTMPGRFMRLGALIRF